MKKETKRLPNGLEAEIITQDDNTTTLVEVRDQGGRVVVKLREFSTFKEADRFVAGLIRAGPGEDPALKEREERFRKMGLSEAEAAVAARDDRMQDA